MRGWRRRDDADDPPSPPAPAGPGGGSWGRPALGIQPGGGARGAGGGRAAGLAGALRAAGGDWSEERGGCFSCSEGPAALARALEVELALGGEAARARLECAFREAIEEPSGLAAVLAPIACPRGAGSGPSGESLARVLLSCSGARGGAAAALLERAALMGDSPEELAGCRAVLAQFRWLDGAVDGGSALLHKLLEVFELFPAPIQPEVCSFLPELVADDAQAEVVAGALLRKLEGNSAFAAPVVAALQEFQLGEELRGRASELAAEQVGAAELRDVPGLVRFALQAAPPAQGPGVLRSLRRGLPFAVAPPGDPRRAAPDPNGKGRRAGPAEGSPVLDAVRLALRCSSDARDLVLQEVRQVDAPGEHVRFDLYLLLALHSLGGESAKAALGVLVKKLAGGHAGAAWLDGAVRGHRATLEENYAVSLQACAEALLQAKEPALQGFGEQLYCLVFSTFASARHRQAALGGLVGHCGEGAPAEASGALRALAALARDHCTDLSRFGSFLVTLLDHLGRFNRSQLYLVFGLFSDLVAHPYAQASCLEQALQSRLEDEFYIVVRKQLSSSLARHRRVGVVASIAFAERLLAAAGGAASGDCKAHLEKEALAMLGQTLEQSRGRPGVLGFFCEEMASVVRSGAVGSGPLLAWLRDQVEESFEGTFVGDLDDPARWGDGTAADRGGRPWFNLDPSDASLAIRILPLAASARESERHLLFSMCSQLRLLSAVVWAQKGSLEDIDALLGAPMHLVPDGWLEKFEDLLPEDQDLCCQTLFFACTWVVELINVYSLPLVESAATQADPAQGFLRKLCLRLRNLQQLQALLGACLQHAPDGRVPKMRELTGGPQSSRSAGAPGALGEAGREVVPHVRVSTLLPKGKKGGELAQGAGSEASAKPGLGRAIVASLKGNGCFRPLDDTALALLRVREAPKDFCGCSREETLIPMKVDLLEELARRAGDLAAAKRVGLSEASAQALGRAAIGALPSVRSHLALCVSVASGELLDAGGRGASGCRHMEPVGDSGVSCPGEAVLEIMAGETGDTVSAAQRSCSFALQALSSLLRSCSKQRPAQSDFTAILRSLSTAGPDEPKLHVHLADVMEWLRSLKQYFVDSFEPRHLCITTLSLLQECAAKCRGLADAAELQALRSEVSLSAGDILADPWNDDEAGSNNAWKGRKAQLRFFILKHVRFSEEPVEVIGRFVQEGLSQVSTDTKEKTPVPAFPAISSATLEVWVAALLAETAAVFESLGAKAQQIAAQAPHAAVGSSAFQQSVENVLTRVLGTIRLASALVGLVKRHHHRHGLQKAVVRWGTALVLGFLKMADFLERQLIENRDAVVLAVRELQKVTKVLQVVAAESKTRKDLAIASRVPALKRALEKFVWRCKVMFKDEPSFWMGNLKHKNLQGDQVCSQAYEEEASEEEEEEAPEDTEASEDAEAGLPLQEEEGVGEEEQESEECETSA